MKPESVVSVMFLFVLVQECQSLSISGLFRKLKQKQRSIETYPNVAAADNFAESMALSDALKQTFVRPIGSVAGKAIIPRRWTTNQRIDDVFVDENGIAFPVRTFNPYSNLRGGRSGIYQ